MVNTYEKNMYLSNKNNSNPSNDNIIYNDSKMLNSSLTKPLFNF